MSAAQPSRVFDLVRAIAPDDWLELFVVANLAFLGLDIFIAHAANTFAVTTEWIPVVFSAVAPLVLVPGLLSRRLRVKMPGLGLAVGAVSIVVGVAGMLFHLNSSFFAEQTLHHLVYTAPFVAPLSYAGVGLLLVLNRLEAGGSLAWSGWVLFLTLGGFLGNLVLSLLDHAQNGFFHLSEWVAVAAGAMGTSFLFLLVLRPFDVALRRATLVVLGLEAAVGLLGFALHLRGGLLEDQPVPLWDRLVFGAPAFAPLLYSNLALLGVLGLNSLEHPRERDAS